ncbi:hypothetical protein MTBBW1_1020032 [Desulfamplus magnetovallimortis]|uniref:Uncharacterized protein n=1 Tax=Desulfamplus magnetovallimortis TaxID=1246637 RepID=A0A1W1H566_9BACT|nr:hypothetical protein [Desulfamplus magnetovallimortis]SLM27508.1 hypothetical protein MTBBW1_1020032 [Desulfamplus magnetovallimortis]
MESLHFCSSTDVIKNSLFLLFIGGCFSYIVWRACIDPDFRRSDLSSGDSYPLMGIIAACIVMIIFSFIAYPDNFYRLDTDNNGIHLYFWPERKKFVNCKDIRLIDYLALGKGNGECVVVLKDNEHIRSVSIEINRLKPMKKITDTICRF